MSRYVTCIAPGLTFPHHTTSGLYTHEGRSDVNHHKDSIAILPRKHRPKVPAWFAGYKAYCKEYDLIPPGSMQSLSEGTQTVWQRIARAVLRAGRVK